MVFFVKRPFRQESYIQSETFLGLKVNLLYTVLQYMLADVDVDVTL